MMSEEAIRAILHAISSGATLSDIHTFCLEKGWSEEDFFLAFKAAENLYTAIQAQEQELKNRPPPFGRKP